MSTSSLNQAHTDKATTVTTDIAGIVSREAWLTMKVNSMYSEKISIASKDNTEITFSSI
jgi:hypothetical protein